MISELSSREKKLLNLNKVRVHVKSGLGEESARTQLHRRYSGERRETRMSVSARASKEAILKSVTAVDYL